MSFKPISDDPHRRKTVHILSPCILTLPLITDNSRQTLCRHPHVRTYLRTYLVEDVGGLLVREIWRLHHRLLVLVDAQPEDMVQRRLSVPGDGWQFSERSAFYFRDASLLGYINSSLYSSRKHPVYAHVVGCVPAPVCTRHQGANDTEATSWKYCFLAKTAIWTLGRRQLAISTRTFPIKKITSEQKQEYRIIYPSRRVEALHHSEEFTEMFPSSVW